MHNTHAEPDWARLPSQFREFTEKLAGERDKFTRGADNAADLGAMARSLHATIDFLLAVCPGAPQLTDALAALGQALANLDNGSASPVLQPRIKHYSHTRPLEHMLHWAVGAAAITLLVSDDHIPLDEAIRAVEREFTSRGIPLPGQNRSMSSGLKNWRDRLMQRVFDGEAPHIDDMDYIKQVYDKALIDARRVATASGVTAGTLALSALRETFATEN